MGEVVPFDRERALRARRESGRIAGDPLFWICCMSPFGMACLIGLAVATAWGPRR